MNVDDLKPAPYNPRNAKKGALEGLSASMEEFGDLSGITWNKRTGNLVCGHQRVRQLKELGAEFDGTSDEPFFMLGAEVFPVRVVDWDEEKEIAANVEANNQEIQGHFTDDLGPALERIKMGMDDDKFKALRFDKLEDKFAKVAGGIAEETEGEVTFSEELLESRNYVVLFFDNEIDWLAAKTHFELDSAYSRRSNGKPWSKGIGRVIDGAKYLTKVSGRTQ